MALEVVVGDWIRTLRESLHERSCVLIGVQGLQGSGKSTLCKTLERAIPGCVSLSLDDFYYPDSRIDREHNDPRLRGRGNPGTHDVQHLYACLSRLHEGGGGEVHVPIYDKYMHAGRGDQTGRTRSIDVTSAHVVLLEGWCVGFRPHGRAGDLVDEHLQAYVPIFRLLDGLVVLEANLEWVYEWRGEAEPSHGMQNTVAFVDRFIPTYNEYLSRFYAEERPTHERLHVRLDRRRSLCDYRVKRALRQSSE